MRRVLGSPPFDRGGSRGRGRRGLGFTPTSVWLQNCPAAPELYRWPEQTFQDQLHVSSRWMCQTQRMWEVVPVSRRDARRSSRRGLRGQHSTLGAGSHHPSHPSITAPASPLGPPCPVGLRPLPSTGGHYRGVSRGCQRYCLRCHSAGTTPRPPQDSSRTPAEASMHSGSTEGLTVWLTSPNYSLGGRPCLWE